MRDEGGGADAFAGTVALSASPRSAFATSEIGMGSGSSSSLSQGEWPVTAARYVRETTPRDELHLAVRIEQQDGGAIAIERGLDGVERRVVDVLERRCAMQLFAQ